MEPVVTGAQENMQAIGKGDDYFKDALLTSDTAYHSTDWIGRQKLLKRDGGEDRHRPGTGGVSSPN